MDELHPRHRYGTYALIFALLALVFAGFSKGAVWATSESELSTTLIDFAGDDVTIDASIESDLYLREMETEIEGTTVFIYFSEEEIEEEYDFSETETYDQLAQSSHGNVSSTFEDMDSAGAVAEWMIWIGVGTTIITAILCFCSLAQILPSRPTLLAGGISAAMLFFTPIVWFILLPSDGTYTNGDMLGSAAFFFDGEPELPINFDPFPSTGLFLSFLGGLCATAMMAMLVRYNRAELTEEKPSWMISNDSAIMPEPTLLDLISRDGDSISLNFSALKSKPKKLVMPGIQILVIVLFSFALSGTWASYTIGFDELEPGLGNEDIFFTEEEIIIGQGDDSIKISYDMGMDESWEEMGEVIGQSVTIGSIAIWMLILSLVWRFAVSTGGAQKIPALCQHHRIIDTSLMTGGSLLAFVSLLYFTIKSPSSAELFTDIPNEMIDGGTSFLILFLTVLFVPFSIAVFTFGEHGAPVRNFLRSFDIPIPGEEEDVATASSSSERSEEVGTLLQNPFNNPRISGLPWVTIGIVIMVLFALGGGGYLAYKIVGSSDDSEGTQTMMLYDLSYDTFSFSQAFDSVNVEGGQVVTWTFDQESAPDDSSLYAIFITFDYDETDPDPLCDTLDVAIYHTPMMFDSQNSTSQGSVDDCSQIDLELYIERGLECSNANILSPMMLNSDEVDLLLAYCNEHDGGVGTWEFSIYVEDNGGPFENGEEVTMTVEPVFATIAITEESDSEE